MGLPTMGMATRPAPRLLSDDVFRNDYYLCNVKYTSFSVIVAISVNETPLISITVFRYAQRFNGGGGTVCVGRRPPSALAKPYRRRRLRRRYACWFCRRTYCLERNKTAASVIDVEATRGPSRSARRRRRSRSRAVGSAEVSRCNFSRTPHRAFSRRATDDRNSIRRSSVRNTVRVLVMQCKIKSRSVQPIIVIVIK